MVFKAMRMEEKKSFWWYGLPIRVANSLRAEGVESKEDLLQKIHSGKLNLRATPNIGKLSIEIISEWLGSSVDSEATKSRYRKYSQAIAGMISEDV